MFKQILAIARNTFREAVRNRILYLILFFALIMIGSSGVVGELTVASRDKIIKDLGFVSINLFGVAIAIFVGVSLVYNELERKSIYTIVSKPVARWQFLLGKFLGLLMTVYVNLIVMTYFFLFMLHHAAAAASGASFGGAVLSSLARAAVNFVSWNAFEATRNIMPVIAATMMELAIVTSFAILYSAFSTPTLSSIFTTLTFIAGRSNEQIVLFSEYVLQKAEKAGTDIPASHYLAKAAAHVVPNLGVYRRTVEQALYHERVDIWWESVAYAFVYPAAVLCLAALVFNRRNFK